MHRGLLRRRATPVGLALAVVLVAACDTSTPPPPPDPIPSATSTVDPPDTLRSEGGTVRYTGAESGVLTYASTTCTTLDDAVTALAAPDPETGGRSRTPTLQVSISGAEHRVSFSAGTGYEARGQDLVLVRRTADTFVVSFASLGLDPTHGTSGTNRVVVTGQLSCGRIDQQFRPTPAAPCVRRPLTCRS